MANKLVIDPSPTLQQLLSKTRARSLPDAETTDVLATAQQMSVNCAPSDYRGIVDLLKSLTDPSNAEIDGDVLQKMQDTKILGIHVGFPIGVDKCPFGRSNVGINAFELNPFTLLVSSFAEWKTAQTKRRTVIIFKLSEPILIYKNVEWQKSPVLLPDGSQRDFFGRHYIASAEVTALRSGETFDMTTGLDKEGFIRPTLSNSRPMDAKDSLIDYVRSRRRDRKTQQQPIDLLT